MLVSDTPRKIDKFEVLPENKETRLALCGAFLLSAKLDFGITFPDPPTIGCNSFLLKQSLEEKMKFSKNYNWKDLPEFEPVGCCIETKKVWGACISRYETKENSPPCRGEYSP
jgi:hypothetical protein